MTRRHLLPQTLLAALLGHAFLPAQQTTAPTAHADLAARILEEGLERSHVMRFQDELCHDYGSRLTGSLAFDRAADWAVEQFRAMGLEARLVPWGEWKVGWDREQWTGRMVAPDEFELQVASVAWTAPTKGQARGYLVAVPKDDEQLKALQERVAGDEQFWLWGPLPRGDKTEALRDAVQQLLDRDNVHGLVQSATSTGWNDKKYPNQIRVFGSRTAGLVPYEDRQKWAHAVVRDDQSERIEQALAGDLPVELELELRNRWRKGPVVLNNVVADLVGSEFPDEYVIVCAHLDSWHQATGATDNGTGTCSTLECARILTKIGFKPKRTLRFILWGGEEQGLLGSRQFVVQNRSRMHDVSAVFNHDSGTNWAFSLQVAKSHEADFAALVAPLLGMTPPEADHEGPAFALDVVDVMKPAGGGSDHASFAAVGVPAFSWRLKGPVPYGRGWHSQWDTYSIVRPDFQRHNATVFAVLAAGVAGLDHMLSRDGVERASAGGRGGIDAQLIVETWLGVELDGMTVKEAPKGGLAAKNGLVAGERIVSLAGTEAADAPSLLATLRNLAAQDGVGELVVEHNGERRTLTLRL
ncbi:MAG: M20/M25/M40 family metallo-hydrolase [Planctomycetota bacterium]